MEEPLSNAGPVRTVDEIEDFVVLLAMKLSSGEPLVLSELGYGPRATFS